ncbi:MAG: hypothetical protein LBM75_07755, partial [Myxococcales bacterium]|nr:hypothetical protein [Myxococcales bacterium]
PRIQSIDLFQNLADGMSFHRGAIHGAMFGSIIQNRGRDESSPCAMKKSRADAVWEQDESCIPHLQ